MKLGRKLMRQAYYISGSPSQCSPYLYFICEIKLKGLERNLFIEGDGALFQTEVVGSLCRWPLPSSVSCFPGMRFHVPSQGFSIFLTFKSPCWGRWPAAKLISDHKLTCPGTSFRVFHLLKRPQSKLLPRLSQRRRRHRGADEDKPHWKYGV